MIILVLWIALGSFLGSLYFLVRFIMERKFYRIAWSFGLFAGSVLLFIGGLTFVIGTETSRIVNDYLDSEISRDDWEVYRSVLGTPETNCVRLKDVQDLQFPIIDAGIYLHFTCCKAEAERILNQYPYSCTRLEGKAARVQLENKPLKPFLPGETVYKFSYELQKYKQWRMIYMSADSTAFYCADLYL